MLILLLDLYSFVLLARVLLSWVNLSPDNPLGKVVHQLTEPVLEPIRRVLPSGAGFDFSPLALFLLIRLAQALLVRL